MISTSDAYATLSDPIVDAMMLQLPDAEAWVLSCGHIAGRNAECAVIALAVFVLAFWRDDLDPDGETKVWLVLPQMPHVMLAIGLCPDHLWAPGDDFAFTKADLLRGALNAMHPLSLESALWSLGIAVNRS